VSALISDDKDSDNNRDETDGPAASQEEIKWYSLPPVDALAGPALPMAPINIESPVTNTPPSNHFNLGMSLSYYDGVGNAETVVYKGVMPDGLTHTIHHADGTRLQVHNAYLRLKLQADLSNIPKTPFDYCKEVGQGIMKEEAKALARPCILTPVQQELMDWHHRLYHLSFAKIFRLAEQGHLPKRLMDCKDALPLCVACQFGTAHCRPWQTKGKASGSIHCPDHILPGNGVSTDQIVSAQPGLIPQMSGFLTSRHIWGCTTFCNHVSDFIYVHLMQDFTAKETILAVKAFKKVMAQANCFVKHYHTNIGAFAHKGFLNEFDCKDQKITFCAIGSHHQNGIIQNKNKMLTLSACTLLLHGICMWPQMINTMFWPFAFKAAAERHNCLSINKDGLTPTVILHDVLVDAIPVKTYHTHFCPVYFLDACTQSAGGPGPPKWEPHSCIGVYLGHSPFYAKSVALVFNPCTGRVSPQYHVIFDDTFLTVLYMNAGTEPLHWKDLLKYSFEKATDEDFNLAQEWMSMTDKMPDQVSMPMAGGRITNPFVIVMETQPTNNPVGSTTSNGPTPPPDSSRNQNSNATKVSKGGNKHTSAKVSLLSNAAANLKSKTCRTAPPDDVMANNTRDDFGPLAPPKPSTQNNLLMPQRVNLHESGLWRLPQLKEQVELKGKQQAKANVTWAKKLPTVIALFTLFSLVSDFCVQMPSNPIPPTASFTE
jgi:hypothetical protein